MEYSSHTYLLYEPPPNRDTGNIALLRTTLRADFPTVFSSPTFQLLVYLSQSWPTLTA